MVDRRAKEGLVAKNIILCSDGTGNKGGQGADTNVYKLYNAVELFDPDNLQVIFYDNGVGTHKNKYLRSISGAFGFGFEDNVLDLYEFLARYYDIGDQVFLFGFSRGAATVRAFAGMVEACGLLDRDQCKDGGNSFQESIFQKKLEKARKAYRKHKGRKAGDAFKAELAVKDPDHAPGGDLRIKFVGVWDTVSALGFPQDWSFVLKLIVPILDHGSDWAFPHNYYNYQLNGNVERVYHAVAIDDERTTFHPKVWNERRSDRPQFIEQVWFAGAHSNVGGGYPRAGLSNVALDWMMERAANCDVRFKPGKHDEIRRDGHVHGKLYNSRDGIAIYYRYGPRDIERLCKDRLEGPVKIHDTVFDRIERGTARYAPAFIPDEFEIVETDLANPNKANLDAKRDRIMQKNAARRATRDKVKKWVGLRKVLYSAFVEFTLLVVVASLWFWNSPPKVNVETHQPTGIGWLDCFLWHLNDILHYILPMFVEDFITYIVVVRPLSLPLLAAVILGLWWLRKHFRKNTVRASEELRKLAL